MDHVNVTQSMGSDSYSFVYVAHPRAVTHLSWRKTSKYMPKYVKNHHIMKILCNKLFFTFKLNKIFLV